MPARDADAQRTGAWWTRGLLMEAEALTTQKSTMQSVPDEEHAMPDTTTTSAQTIQADSAAAETLEVSAVIDEADLADEAVADAARGDKTFRDFGVSEPFCAALEAAGITHAFPIQALTLPIALDGHDLIGQARTGTGKTLAFGIPMLQRLELAPAATAVRSAGPGGGAHQGTGHPGRRGSADRRVAQ